MGDWNLGSVHDFVLATVDGVPSSISGARLLEMADRRRNYVNRYAGLSIGSDSIGLDYQMIIANFVSSDVLGMMNLVGIDAASIKLGDLTVKKEGATNTLTSSQYFLKQAENDLRLLGRVVSSRKAYG